MPCYNGGPTIEYYKEKMGEDRESYLDRLKFYNGALCALMHEILREPNGLEIISRAQERGELDFVKWYQGHLEEDKLRIYDSLLRQYSEHERECIFEILKEESEKKGKPSDFFGEI